MSNANHEKHGPLDQFKIENIFESLEDKVETLRKIFLGGQDCHASQSGAFTGDVSARMLLECGCKFVILGHSERRKYHNEDNDIIAKKIGAAVENNLVPILCVGERLELRKDRQHYDFIAKQIDEAIDKNLIIENLIIAYEPIWSIGTDLTPEISQIDEMAQFIREKISKYNNVKNFNILYGGSVKSSNSKKILGVKSVDGLLVGNASLNADEFTKIIF
ncbi:triose-phosphate isomerase [Flavobacteriaceae bacterium]|nr:triose-phosphate isomerase [Flavobacteriaceae bacterium]